MATIKTTGTGSALRVLTKTEGGVQRVSCSCCESFCCVFPASCGKGPQSVIHYGEELPERSPVSLTYGDGFNGVELVDGQWIIYRNGVSRSQSCLGAGVEVEGIPPPLVGALLASTYAVEFIHEGELGFTTTVTFYGFSLATDENCGTNPSQANCGFVGQCGWGGSGGVISDEGIGILFNTDTCRWELQNGPLNFLFAYLEGSSQQSPVGNYEDAGLPAGFSVVVS